MATLMQYYLEWYGNTHVILSKMVAPLKIDKNAMLSNIFLPIDMGILKKSFIFLPF